MTIPTRRQTVPFRPIAGPSGYHLTGYVWQHELLEFVDGRGEERVRRVSDWSQAETADVTGREIVHQFSVVAPDGRELLVSLEQAAKLLGFAKGEEGAKLVQSVSSAVKTLARLRMELAAIEAQNAALRAKNAEHRHDLERLTAEYADRQPVIIPENNPFDGKEEKWEMDGETCWYRPTAGSARYIDLDRQERVEYLRRRAVEARMKELGHTGGLFAARVSVGDLPERIRRQELKIVKMTR